MLALSPRPCAASAISWHRLAVDADGTPDADRDMPPLAVTRVPRLDVTRVPLVEVVTFVQDVLARGDGIIELDVLDPDIAAGRHAGELVDIDGVHGIHRPWRIWLDLAERLGMRMCTPRVLAPHATSAGSAASGETDALPRVRVRLERLDPSSALGCRPDCQIETDDHGAVTERYGTASAFARIHKHEDPGFVLDMADALARAALPPGGRVLDLGVNDGDELALLRALWPTMHEATLVGIDHSPSAIAAARQRFASDPRVELHVADVATLSALGLGRFDLVVSIGTLQSPGIDDRALLRRLVQDHLAPAGAVIIGVPNCRYVDGDVSFGARMRNFRQPELGLLIKDVAFYRKYLQQHHRQVFVTGKHYVLVTGIAR
jgi:SAM-dependent methyltransferase